VNRYDFPAVLSSCVFGTSPVSFSDLGFSTLSQVDAHSHKHIRQLSRKAREAESEKQLERRRCTLLPSPLVYAHSVSLRRTLPTPRSHRAFTYITASGAAFLRCRVLMSVAVTTTHLNIRRFTTRRIIGTCPRCQYGPTLTTLDTKIRSPYCQTIITLLSKVEHSPFRIKVRRVFANYIKLTVRVFFFQRSPGLLPHAPLGLDTTLAPP